MITKKQKEAVLNEMVEVWKSAKSMVFYNFNKMNAEDMESFRKKVRENGLKAFVCKNTLMEKSAEKAGIDLSTLSDEMLIGQTGIIISYEDPLLGPKTISQIIKEKRRPAIKGGFFEGRFLSSQNVKDLASVPSREVLTQQLAYTLLAPATQFASVLNNTVTKLVYAIDAVKRQKEAQS